MAKLDAPAEFPNQVLGMHVVTNTNLAGGAGNAVRAPFQLLTANGPAAFLNSGSGYPTIGGNVGDIYFRVETPNSANQRIYVCTIAGTAGNATWQGIA